MYIKINKRARLLYLLLACFLLFGCVFLPFQRKAANADELSPDNLFEVNSHYLYDIDELIVGNSGTYVSIDYPNAISHDKLLYYHENDISGYFNKRVYGYYIGNTSIEQSPSFDIRFAADYDYINPVGNYFLYKTDFATNYSVPLYQQRSQLMNSNFGMNKAYVKFNDFVVSIGDFFGNSSVNEDLLSRNSFYMYFGTSSPVNVKVSYRYMYNVDSLPDSSEASTGFKFTDTFVNNFTYNPSNGVAGGFIYNACYVPAYHPTILGNNYFVLGNYGSCYRFVCDLVFEISGSFNTITFYNYAYDTPPGTNIGFASALDTTQFYSEEEFLSFDLGNFLLTSINGFFSFELFPGLSLGSLFAVVVALPLAVMILKFFSGG